MSLVMHGSVSALEQAQLESEVVPLRSLQDVVRWAFALSPPSDVAAVVVQDEFSHDVLVPWHRHFLVFDTT